MTSFGILGPIRKKLSKLVFPVLCLLLAVLTSGCSSQTQTIRIAHYHSINHPTHQALEIFENFIETQSNHRYEILLYEDGVLGNSEELIFFTKAGSLDLAIVSCADLAEESEDFSLFFLPYYINSKEELENILDTQLMIHLANSLEGISIYSWILEESHNYYLKEPVEKLSDLENLLIQTRRNDLNFELADLYGYSIWQMSQEEEYAALATGVLDGSEGTILSFLERSLDDVLNFIVLDEHQMTPGFLIGADGFVEQFPPEDQQIWIEGFKLLQESQIEIYSNAYDEALEFLADRQIGWIKPSLEDYEEKIIEIQDRFFMRNPDLLFVDEKIRGDAS